LHPDRRDRAIACSGGPVENIRDTIGPAVLGRSPFAQAELDAQLVALDGTEDRSRLGANALLAVPTAAAQPPRAPRGCRCGNTSAAAR
jgi:enolase